MFTPPEPASVLVMTATGTIAPKASICDTRNLQWLAQGEASPFFVWIVKNVQQIKVFTAD